MSADQLLILKRERLPSIDAVTDAVTKACAVGKLMPMRVDLLNRPGFLPVVFEGRKLGFEHSYDSLDAQIQNLSRFGRCQITASTGSILLQPVAVTVLLKTVALISGAAYDDPQGARLVPPERVQIELSKLTIQRRQMAH